jgi:predicted Zn-dependent protease with MMP-like domain
MVFLYRSPLLDYWIETGEDLTHLVRHVLIHEIGHHFGFSDEDMEGLEGMADEDQEDEE